jgi:hypothetical protein
MHAAAIRNAGVDGIPERTVGVRPIRDFRLPRLTDAAVQFLIAPKPIKIKSSSWFGNVCGAKAQVTWLDSTEEMSMKSDNQLLEEPEPPTVHVCPQCRKVTGHRLPGWSSEGKPRTACYACSSCRSVWRVTGTQIDVLSTPPGADRP